MARVAKIADLVPDAGSEGFGILLHDGPPSDWKDAALVVSGGADTPSREVRVTSSDGGTTIAIQHEEFFSVPHEESVLAISADWTLNGVMDGYVLGTFRRLGKLASEYYQYGALGRLEPVFIELLFSRFAMLRQRGCRALFAVDTLGFSDERDWVSVYEGTAEVPETVAILVAPLGTDCRSAHLTKQVIIDGIVVLSAS